MKYCTPLTACAMNVHTYAPAQLAVKPLTGVILRGCDNSGVKCMDHDPGGLRSETSNQSTKFCCHFPASLKSANLDHGTTTE